jgi:phosphoserine phosphatase
MSLILILVRHGETEWNRIGRFQGRSDIPLNDNGKAQVRALGRVLSKKPLSAIYTSPLVRAMETARAVGAHHPDIDLKEAPGFIEMDLGEFEGIDSGVWAERYPDFRIKWQQRPSSVRMPGGENLKAVQNRAINCLNEIIEQHTDHGNIAICSHNFVIVSLLCHALDVDLDRFREIRQDTAAYSIIRWHDGRFETEKINVRPHL